MRYLRDIVPIVESIERKISALRAKTVARGATAGEAASAHAKANELEKKHGTSIHSSKEDMKARWARMTADMRKQRASV